MSGSTTIVTSGTVSLALDQTLNASTIDLAGTAGAAGLSFTGDAAIGLSLPSIGPASVVQSAVPGQNSAGTTVLTTNGDFLNQGTILANGPTGSTFTLNIQPNGNGTAAALAPGYFVNDGIIAANAGNTLTVNIAGTAVLFNTGTIIANGGSVFINVATDALYAGYAGADGIALIENGGTFETNVSVSPSTAYFSALYAFADGVSGDTLKIDNIQHFAGSIRGFRPGDTIDLGAALSIGTIVYGSALGTSIVLSLENNSSSVIASLAVAGVHNYGTYALVGGTADGFVFSTGANGDTLLTTNAASDAWTNTTGTWQTAAGWSLGVVPGTGTTTDIGQNSTAAFTLTTGASALTTAGFTVWDPNALVRITSTTSLAVNSGTATLTPDGIAQLGGTVEVTAGNTLTSLNYVQYSTGAVLLLDPGSVFNILGALTTSIPNNGVTAINNGGTQAARIAGTVSVDGGTLNAAGGSFYIGYGYPGAPAQVTVANGGTVADTFTIIGADAASYGILTLTGSATNWTDAVDPHDALNSRGYMIVGSNGFGPTTPTGVAQAPLAGTALLSILNGATLTDSRASIGNSLDTSGSVAVTTGGTWNIGAVTGGYLNVSVGGQATLSVTNGGTVNVGAIGALGTFLSNGSSVVGYGIGVGYTAGASGTIEVSGLGSQLTDNDGMNLGRVSQGNALIILNGGFADIGGVLTVGVSAASSGTVGVSGTGSILQSNGLTMGLLGTGVATIADGGVLQIFGDASLGGSSAAPVAGARGTVTVSNGGSLEVDRFYIWGGSTLTVDATSGVDIGPSGAYIAGAVLIENLASLVGDGLIAGSVVNNGTVLASNYYYAPNSTGGKLEITGPVAGSGVLAIASGATLQIDGSISSSQTIAFGAGSPQTLILGAPTSTNAVQITGFSGGDKIAFTNGITVDAASVLNGDTLSVMYHSAINTVGTYNFTHVSFGTNTSLALTTGTDPASGNAYVAAGAPVETLVASFNGTNGRQPYGSLIADANRNLFGTTNQGGVFGYGSVFEIVKTGSTYANTPVTLVSFTSTNGSNPLGSLIADADGNLFGTTSSGGTNGDGSVFEIAKSGNSYASTPTTLFNFAFPEAYAPKGSLLADANGNLFGTTSLGASGFGSVFEIVKTGNTYANAPIVLASFNGSNGANPVGGLIADASGNLFGTTTQGGAFGNGSVFEIANTGSGYASTPITLVSFTYSPVNNPRGDLIVDANGDLFGTSFGGGTPGDYGSVFEIVKTGGSYASAPITLFGFNFSNGANPSGSLIADATGNLFGTTSSGGTLNGGTLFELVKTATGYASTPIVLLNFTGTNGSSPMAALLADTSGNLFGTAALGGANNAGAVFELTNSGFNTRAPLQPLTIAGAVANQTILDTSQVHPFAGVTVSDPNIGQTETVTVTLSSTANGTISNLGGGSFNIASGVYTDTGSAAVITTDLQGLVFTPTPYQVAIGQTVTTGFTIQDSDTAGVSALETTTTVLAAGSGVLSTVPAGGTLTIAGALSPAQIVAFSAGAPGTLILGLPTGTMSNAIAGFAKGDKIEFANGTTPDAVSVLNGNTLAVTYHDSVGNTGTYDLTNVTFAAGTPTTYAVGSDPATNNPFFMPTLFETWIGGTGSSIATAANWNLGTVPDSADFASFTTNAGGTIGGAGTAFQFSFSNGGTWTLTPGTTLSAATEVTVGKPGSAAYVTVQQDLRVGRNGTNGAMTVNGGTVTATGNLRVGSSASFSAGGVDVTTSTGSTLVAGTLSSGNGAVSVTAAGMLSAGSISLGDNLAQSASIGMVSVTAGGTILALAGDLELWRTSGLSLDTMSFVEVGTGGTRVAGAVLIDSGATLGFNSGGRLTGDVIDNGQIAVTGSGAKAEIAGVLSGYGTVNIGSGGTLQLDGNVAAGPTIAFASGAPQTLIFGAPSAAMATAISGLAVGDKIEFSNGIAVTSAAIVNGNTLSVSYRNAGNIAGTYNLTNVTFAAGKATAYRYGIDTATGYAYVTPGPDIAIGPVNPTVTTPDTVPVMPFTGTSIYDPNIGQTETLTVTLSAPANGILSNLGGGSYNSSTGIYIDTGSAAAVAAALNGLVFTPTAGQVAPGQTVTTVLTAADTDTGGFAAASTIVSIIATAGTLLPTILGGLAGQKTNDASTLKPFSQVVISDSNFGQTETVTVTLSAAANGLLSNLGGGSYNSSTGIYTDTGSAAAVTSALANLVFTPAAHQVAPGQAVSTTFTIEDTDTAGASALDSRTTVIATAGTVLPTISGVTELHPVSDLGTVTPFTGVTIGDLNFGQTESLTVTLSAIANGVLSNLGGGSYNSSTGVYSATGSAASVTAALDGLVFAPAAHQVAPSQTVATSFTIKDSNTAGASNINSNTTVIATAGTVGLTIAGTVAGQKTTDTTALRPFSQVIVTDPNFGQTETVTITLSAAANGTLSNLGGGSYNASTGIYTDTASAAAVSAALAGLVFTPTARQVGPGQTVTTIFAIKDTDSAAITASDNTTTVIAAATAVAVPPTIGGTVAGQNTTDLAALTPFTKVTVTDSNIGQTETLTVTLSAAANGTLSNLGGGSYNASTGVYTVAGSASIVTAALDALVFTPTPHQKAAPNTVTTTFIIADVDTAAATVSDNRTTVIAASSTVIEAAGATSLDLIANNYAMLPTGGGTSVLLKYNGAAVTTGQFGATVNPIGAEATTGGYEVAWKVSGASSAADQYIVWNTDANGNYLSSPTGLVSRTDPVLENIETSFKQDLNGDGTVGLTLTVIEAVGATSLDLIANNYAMLPTGGGTNALLKYNGAAVTTGQFGATVNPIGAEATTGGYEVAWKVTGASSAADQYIVWNTDAGGNYLNSPTGVVSGQDFATENAEPRFRQDLNGDGLLSTRLITAAGPSNTVNLTGQSQATTINLGANTASASAGLKAPSLTFIGTPYAITLGSGASIVEYALQASSGIETISNFVFGSDRMNIDLFGGASSTLNSYDTTVGGVHAIALASSGDAAHGIVLLNMTGGQTAASLLASHTTFLGGHALIG